MPIMEVNQLEFLEGDIRDYTSLLDACKGVDVVFHNVAQVPLAKDKKSIYSVNNLGTKNILNACIKSGVKKLIYTSSSAVCRVPSTNPVTEKMLPKPMESYGIQNMMQKDYVKTIFQINLM